MDWLFVISLSLAGIYLLIGAVYGVYLLLFSYDKWYWFPINILGGPVILLKVWYLTARGRKIKV